uniref:Uncharacterized protein n=1 Tax=Timema shepardi TaxID=629360 RepID=A0A7R9B4D6_TIMSH|nr:unnamed protein product [Timema shepardi]
MASLVLTDSSQLTSDSQHLALQRMRTDFRWLVLRSDWFSRDEHLRQSRPSRDELNLSRTSRAEEAEISCDWFRTRHVTAFLFCSCFSVNV